MRLTVTFVLLTGLLLVEVLLPGCFLHKPADPRSTPAGVVEAFLTAFQGKDVDTMISLHGEQNLSPEDRNFLERLTKLVEVKDFTVSVVEQLSLDEAVVQAEITVVIFEREFTQTTAYRVIRKDGQWSLCGQPALP